MYASSISQAEEHRRRSSASCAASEILTFLKLKYLFLQLSSSNKQPTTTFTGCRLLEVVAYSQWSRWWMPPPPPPPPPLNTSSIPRWPLRSLAMVCRKWMRTAFQRTEDDVTYVYKTSQPTDLQTDKIKCVWRVICDWYNYAQEAQEEEEVYYWGDTMAIHPHHPTRSCCDVTWKRSNSNRTANRQLD